MSTLTSELVTEASLSLRLETALGDRNFTPLSTSKGTRPSEVATCAHHDGSDFQRKAALFSPVNSVLKPWPCGQKQHRSHDYVN